MTKRKRDIGSEILEGIRQIKRGEYGRVSEVSVKTIREGTGLSRPKFAQLLRVSVRTLQKWEQGGPLPSGAARTLLIIAAKSPRGLQAIAGIGHDPKASGREHDRWLYGRCRAR